MGMNPKSGVTLRRDLSETANQFNDQLASMGLIADRVAPIHKVGEAAATYPIITRDNFLKEDDTKRRDDGSYNFISGEFDSGSYDCVDEGLATILDDAKRRRYASFLDMENAMTRILTWRMKIRRERQVASMVMSTSTHTATNAATTWATAASADPAADIETGIITIGQKTGIPRGMISAIIPSYAFNLMVRTAAIIDQAKYTFAGNGGLRPSILTAEHMAAILRIKEVIVPEMAYDSKPEGETETLSAIWGTSKVQLAVLAMGDQPLDMPAAWRTMLWTADSPVWPVVERYYSDDRRGEVVRVRANTDEVATAEADLMNYMIDALAAS